MNSRVENIESPEKYYLPQGAPTSPILTNIVCLDLDNELTELSKRFGVTYSQYADDMSFRSNNNVFSKNGDFLKNLKKKLFIHIICSLILAKPDYSTLVNGKK